MWSKPHQHSYSRYVGSKDSGAKTLPFFSEPLLLADGKVLKSNELANMGLTATKIVNEYYQEIPQSQTADNPVAPRGRAAQPSQDTRKTN